VEGLPDEYPAARFCGLKDHDLGLSGRGDHRLRRDSEAMSILLNDHTRGSDEIRIHPNTKTLPSPAPAETRFRRARPLARLQVEVCSSCHPFYTGKQKILDTGGA